MNTFEQDMALAREIARRAADAGGRAMLVGGVVRDALLGAACKDIDMEIYSGEVIGLLLKENPASVLERVPIEALEHHTAIILWPALPIRAKH